MRNWKIYVTDNSATSTFAAEEFIRLIKAMDKSITAEQVNDDREDAVHIGLGKTPIPTEDPQIDDAILIDIQNGKGTITGSNERSVLIGVYRFFREAGCLFLHPGRDGEYIPEKDSMSLNISISEKAAYRHRGICLEGSCSYENVAEMIDFAPKLGFNEYFTQLFRPSFAFKRWYEHQSNPSLLPTPISNETIDSFVDSYDKQISLRGLHHHRIGHGWASKLIGITSGAWHELNDESEVIESRRNLIAVIDGERKLYKGSGIDTNLCYSDPEVQELMAESVVSYAKEHPQTKYLHFWLADQLNNQCECERCAAHRPSDLYADMLNEIDSRLACEGLDTKIVFLIYLDLLWEPKRAKIKNPDRFIMMFAPIRRSYSVPMASDEGRKPLPYKRNGFALTEGAGAYLPYLKAWQEIFSGDSFIFDYHYMWDYINDPGCFESVRIMAQDVEDFKKLGLNGFMSCQNQRVFMPNGLGMNVIGDTLWTGRNNFDKLSHEYYSITYGKDSEECLKFMKTLSELFDPKILRGEISVRSEGNTERYKNLIRKTEEFTPIIAKNLTTTENKRAWECMSFYVSLCRKLAEVMYHAANADTESMNNAWTRARSFACENELKFQREFDVFELFNVWENKILPKLK